jgi:hypothetical protein
MPSFGFSPQASPLSLRSGLRISRKSEECSSRTSPTQERSLKQRTIDPFRYMEDPVWFARPGASFARALVCPPNARFGAPSYRQTYVNLVIVYKVAIRLSFKTPPKALPGGSSSRPPFSRVARRVVTCKAPSLPWITH